jgi:hypothetical protein
VLPAKPGRVAVRPLELAPEQDLGKAHPTAKGFRKFRCSTRRAHVVKLPPNAPSVSLSAQLTADATARS